MSLLIPLEKQAAALDEIRQMHADLTEAQTTIRDLERDLGRAQDQIALLSDERVRLRKELNIYRSTIVELATSQANIGLLARKGEESLLAITELMDKVDGTEAPEDQSETKRAAMASALAAVDQATQGSGETEVEALSEGASLPPR